MGKRSVGFERVWVDGALEGRTVRFRHAGFKGMLGCPQPGQLGVVRVMTFEGNRSYGVDIEGHPGVHLSGDEECLFSDWELLVH